MKETFKDIFEKLEHCSHIPEQYYGYIMTLAGMVYDDSPDVEIDNDLKNLSMAYESMENSTLGKIQKIVHEIVFWTKQKSESHIPDVEHLLHDYRNASIDQINSLIANLAQLYGNRSLAVDENRPIHIVADFTPLLAALQQLTERIQPTKIYEFNLPRIIGWITNKGMEKGFLDETENDD